MEDRFITDYEVLNTLEDSDFEVDDEAQPWLSASRGWWWNLNWCRSFSMEWEHHRNSTCRRSSRKYTFI